MLTGLPDKKSPARSVFNLAFAEELTKHRIKVTILYLRAINPKKSFFLDNNINGIRCFEVRSSIPKYGLIKNSLFQPRLFKLLLNNKVLSNHLKDIDVIHTIGGGAVEASYLISKKFNTPMISQFIGSDLNMHFENLLKKRDFKKGIERSSCLCFNSKGLKEVFLSKFPERRNTKVLYRGVKLDDFPYTFSRPRIINLLFLGGFPGNGNLKGGLTLIKAIGLLDKKTLPTKIKISIGGPNSFDFKSVLQEIQNPNIELEFNGAVSKSIVKQKMNESHIVIIPSLAEGLPNVLYEAMASGNMVIASNIGGIPEILEPGKTGELVGPNNSTLLMDSILNSINDIDYIEQCAIQGRKKIEEMDYSKFIEGYIQVYKDSRDSKS